MINYQIGRVITMNRKLEIELCLDDIKEYVNSTLLYLSGQGKNLDKNEILGYLISFGFNSPRLCLEAN